MGRKFDIPKHIDFVPSKENKKFFDRENDGFVSIKNDLPFFKKDKICGVCGKQYEFRLKVFVDDNGRKSCLHD